MGIPPFSPRSLALPRGSGRDSASPNQSHGVGTMANLQYWLVVSTHMQGKNSYSLGILPGMVEDSRKKNQVGTNQAFTILSPTCNMLNTFSVEKASEGEKSIATHWNPCPASNTHLLMQAVWKQWPPHWKVNCFRSKGGTPTCAGLSMLQGNCDTFSAAPNSSKQIVPGIKMQSSSRLL